MPTPLTSLLLCLLAQDPNPAPATILLEADRIHVTPTNVLAPGRLLIRDGRVAYVGNEIPEDAIRGAQRLTVKGVVTATFASAHSYLGQATDLNERYRAANPELRAVDGFDPFADQLAEVAASGLTLVALAPVSGGPIPGVAGLVALGADASIVEADAYLKLALVPDALDQERGPTSIMGAADLLRRRFRAARTAAVDDGSTTLRSAIVGGLRLAIHANSHGEILTALDLCEEWSVRPLLLGGAEVEKSISRLATLQGSVVLGAPTFADREDRLGIAAKLEQAKVPFSFAGDDGHAMRVGAVLAMRGGLTRAGALAALTQTPAEQLGVGNVRGTLLRDHVADFAVWSGDPLDLSSRLLAVHVGGRKIDAKPAGANR
jgi:imidazolonepropionase-like amidohydrolase